MMRNLRFASFVFVCCACLLASSASAEPLRWKLQAGQKFAVEMTQTTDSAAVYPGKREATAVVTRTVRDVTTMRLALAWEVLSADSGKFSIRQRVTGYALVVDQGEGKIEYDSAVKKIASAAAKQIQSRFDPLLAEDVFLTIGMTDRGEIESAEASPGLTKLMASESAEKNKLFTRDGTTEMLKRALLPLPAEEIQAGESWTTKRDATTRLGAVAQEDAYTLVGEVDRSGKKMQQIKVKTSLTPPAKATVKVKEQSLAGEFFFDPAAGVLAESSHQHKLITESTYRDTKIVVTLESKLETKIAPESAKPE